MTQPIVERFITQGKVVENKKANLPPKTLCRAVYEICTVGKKNRNNRIYEKAVWERVLQDKEIQEKLNNKSMFFHAEHPTTTQSSGEKIAGVVTGININENDGKVSATMDVLETPYGQIVDTLLQAGCGIGVSTRADGELEEAVDEAGQKYSRVVPESYRFVTVDFTADPSNFGSELPMNVQRNVVGAIKAGLDNEKIDRQYATVLLEKLTCVEAGTILESLKIDQHHKECKCKPTEKACKKCPLALKEDVKCPQCQSEMVGYKDGVICPQCGNPNEDQVEEPQTSNDTTIPPAVPLGQAEAEAKPVESKKVNEYIKKVGNQWQVTSKKGKNLGRYKSKAEAHKRLGQVEYFKKNESKVNEEEHKGFKIEKQENGKYEIVNPKGRTVGVDILSVESAKKYIDAKVLAESKVNEVEFTNLDSILSSDQPLSEEDLVAAVKLSMSAEFDATELYKKIADATDNEMAKKVMQSIADEESIHAGEFRKLIATLQPGEEKLEVKGEKEAGDLIDQTSPSESVKESLLKPGHKVKYQGKEWTVKAVDEEEGLIILDSGFNTTVSVTPEEVEDFLNEEVTSSDTSAQPADAKAAEEVMKKSVKRNAEVKEGYNDVACNDCGYVGHLNSFSRGERDALTCPSCKSVQLGFKGDKKPVVKEDVQLDIEIDPKVEQFLHDNWASFVDDEDKVNNLVKLFKITPAKAKEYVDRVANGKATMNAVYTMAEASWKRKAETLEETIKQLNAVIDVLKEDNARIREDKDKTISSLKESQDKGVKVLDSLRKSESTLSAEVKKLQEAGQSLVKEYEKKVKLLKEQHNKELIKFYVDARTKAIRLNLSPKALTILESCQTKEDVDSEIRRLQNEIREAALQSGVPTEISVTKTVQVSPVMHDINNKVAKAFQSFGA